MVPTDLIQQLGFDDNLEVSRLAGNSSVNYLLRSSSNAVVVKELLEHTSQNTETEAEYRNFLRSEGFLVTPLIKFADGKYTFHHEGRNYAALSYCEGSTLQTQGVSAAKIIGKELAKIHMLGGQALPEKHNYYHRDYVARAMNHIADEHHAAKKSLLAAKESFPNFWDLDIPQGIIHGDLHQGNIIVDASDAIVSIIDWAESGVEPFILDIGESARSVSVVNGVVDETLFRAFVDSYQMVRLLAEQEKSLLEDAVNYSVFITSVWAHIKHSQGIFEEKFDEIGNRYVTKLVVPKVDG